MKSQNYFDTTSSIYDFLLKNHSKFKSASPYAVFNSWASLHSVTIPFELTPHLIVFIRDIQKVLTVPFEIKAKAPNSETVKALEDAVRGENVTGPFGSVDELMRNLSA